MMARMTVLLWLLTKCRMDGISARAPVPSTNVVRNLFWQHQQRLCALPFTDTPTRIPSLPVLVLARTCHESLAVALLLYAPTLPATRRYTPWLWSLRRAGVDAALHAELCSLRAGNYRSSRNPAVATSHVAWPIRNGIVATWCRATRRRWPCL